MLGEVPFCTTRTLPNQKRNEAKELQSFRTKYKRFVISCLYFNSNIKAGASFSEVPGQS